MNYFDHSFLSNSDLKSFRKKLGLAHENPANLQQIFDFGSNFHAGILEPHKLGDIPATEEEMKLIKAMSKTFFKDAMCGNFIMAADFKREEAFYNEIEVGGYKIKARCKADGVRIKMGCFLEIKGLGVETEKAFKEALTRFDYDQGIVHYMLTSKCDLALIVGISKRKPDRLFKKIVKKHDDFYLIGEDKLINTLKLLQEFSPEDVVSV